jgi:hypothetical protein
MMSADVFSWWTLLCVVSAINILAWLTSGLALNRRWSALDAETRAMRRLQLQLSAVYVFGCAFRSVTPVFDIPRICLFNSWLSSVAVGRSVATCAELCFVAQWALMLREISRSTGSRFGAFAARALVPLVAVAEICSWYSVLTTSNIGHVLEESIWGLSAALLVASVGAVWTRCLRTHRHVLVTWGVAGAAYAAYMFMVDVPRYWSRWLADEAHGRHYMSIVQGMRDVASRWLVSYRWDDWKSEVIWMTLYFSVAVWLSIALIHAPAFQTRMAALEPNRLRGGLGRSGNLAAEN